MKKIILMAVAAFALNFTVNAQQQSQDNKTRKEYRQNNPNRQFAQLDLTQEQKDKMQKIREDAKSQRTAIQNDKSLTDQERSVKLREISANNRKEMNAILTPDQLAKVQSLQKNRQNFSKKNFQRGKMNKSGMSSRFANLNLIQEQKTQLQKIREDAKAGKDAIKNDKTLTDQQRAEKMKQLSQENRKKMNDILTPEQQQQMKSSMKGRKGQKPAGQFKKNKNHQKTNSQDGVI